MKCDRGTSFYRGIFQNFLRVESINYYSRFTDKRPSIAETFIPSMRNLLKKPVSQS